MCSACASQRVYLRDGMYRCSACGQLWNAVSGVAGIETIGPIDPNAAFLKLLNERVPLKHHAPPTAQENQGYSREPNP